MKCPLVGTFFTNHVPRMLYVKYQIYQILPLFVPYWAPIGASPLIFAQMNPHFPKMLPTKFGLNHFCSFGEEVV